MTEAPGRYFGSETYAAFAADGLSVLPKSDAEEHGQEVVMFWITKRINENVDQMMFQATSEDQILEELSQLDCGLYDIFDFDSSTTRSVTVTANHEVVVGSPEYL